ncbi:MAG: ABC transporter ATP-binding protein [Candidatus Heimdallarchaeota archaeon]|nr:ABC transporter ATP-binding protein [Candidatus Heimdallarchaeota archaeon]
MKKPILEAKQLSTTFQNRDDSHLSVLDNLSFEINEREFVCVLGPSGSGKSTLLRILAGLIPYTSGKVLIEGEEITQPRSNVGVVFQNSNLMPWRTVIENISLPLEIKKQDSKEISKLAAELIKLVGLEGFEDSFPLELSGGMSQRVAIARALVQDPDILLLDEPFGSLDTITREKMWGELLRIWNARRKTVIMITHNIQEALFLADRIIVLSDRPATILLDIKVDLERPRSEDIRYTKKFIKLEKKLRNSIQ